MRPVDETPTQPSHYAALSLTYGALLGTLAASARDREPIPARELVPLSAATFALSKLIVREKADTWIRRPLVEEQPGEARPRGGGLRCATGELLTCTPCTGAWSALALVGLRLHAPATGRTVASLLATSAGNDFMHAAFSYVCWRANPQQDETGTPSPLRAAAPRRDRAR